jgi:hypothetical protein
MRVVLLILYIVVPGLWLTIIGFAGYQVSSMSSSFNEGLNIIKLSVESSTSKIMKQVK